MGIRRDFSRVEQSRHFANPFHVADDAMQMDVHKRFTLSTPQRKCPILRQQLQKLCFVGSNGSFSLILLFAHRLKLRCLPLSTVTAGATPWDFSLDIVIFRQK